MTVGEFKSMIERMAQARISLDAYADYIKHAKREDKYFREEYLAIHAVIEHKSVGDDVEIVLGDEISEWDAQVGKDDTCEVVQALPDKEHEVRRELPNGCSPATWHEHANDHTQFPGAIVDAIRAKHSKHYADERTLVVVFDGDYAAEDDDVIRNWVNVIRKDTSIGNFKEVLLVERGRQNVWPVF